MWQTMDTAPRDGTKIDLLYPYPRGRTINCFWRGAHGMGWASRSPTWGDGGELLPETEWDVSTYPNMQPTHWMPAPTLPPEALPKVPGAEVVVIGTM